MTNGLEAETTEFGAGRRFAYLARDEDGPVTVRTGVVAEDGVTNSGDTLVPIVDTEMAPGASKPSSRLVAVTDVTETAPGRNRHSAGNRLRSLPWRVFHVGRHRRA
ncbi:hypothetical protein ACWEOE_35685 [Amycolatopsis sp. NPDC004368]